MGTTAHVICHVGLCILMFSTSQGIYIDTGYGLHKYNMFMLSISLNITAQFRLSFLSQSFDESVLSTLSHYGSVCWLIFHLAHWDYWVFKWQQFHFRGSGGVGVNSENSHPGL